MTDHIPVYIYVHGILITKLVLTISCDFSTKTIVITYNIIDICNTI